MKSSSVHRMALTEIDYKFRSFRRDSRTRAGSWMISSKIQPKNCWLPEELRFSTWERFTVRQVLMTLQRAPANSQVLDNFPLNICEVHPDNHEAGRSVKSICINIQNHQKSPVTLRLLVWLCNCASLLLCASGQVNGCAGPAGKQFARRPICIWSSVCKHRNWNRPSWRVILGIVPLCIGPQPLDTVGSTRMLHLASSLEEFSWRNN